MSKKKPDTSKRKWSVLDPLRPFVASVVDVLMHGNTKYVPHSWQGVDPVEFREALDRHWHAYLTGQRVDEESGQTHLAHVACNALFLAWFDAQAEAAVLGPTTMKIVDSWLTEQKDRAGS